MRQAIQKTLIVVSSFLAAAALLPVGCSSSSSDAEPAALDGGPFCPASLAAALAADTTCQGEGFECPIGYACGAFAQQAICKCTGGKFTCADPHGAAIDSADNAPCTPSGGGAANECPAAESGTDGKSCSTPGLQCFYTGVTCVGKQAPNTDVCQCKTQGLADGGPSLAFHCEVDYCSATSDATVPPPPVVDAGTD